MTACVSVATVFRLMSWLVVGCFGFTQTILKVKRTPTAKHLPTDMFGGFEGFISARCVIAGVSRLYLSEFMFIWSQTLVCNSGPQLWLFFYLSTLVYFVTVVIWEFGML